MQRPAIGAFQKQLSMMAVRPSSHGRRRRPEQSNGPGVERPGCASRGFEKLDGGLRLGGGCAQRRESRERRPGSATPFFECGRRKGVVAAREQTRKQGVFWIFGLDQHFARATGPTCSSGHLDDGLREPLGGAKVGTKKALIGIKYDDERE